MTPVRNVLLFACALALAGCSRSQSADTPQAGPPEVGVATIAAQSVAITAEVAGRTSAYLVAEVRPQVSGIIQKRLFTEGGEVRAGQALYQIDPATYEAAVASAQASLARADANLANATPKAERYRELAAINAVSIQEHDEAQASLKQARAEVLSAKAALDTARINLGYTKVVSPISGRIGKSAVTPGALVTASQAAALARVQQLDPMYVDLTQSSADLLRLQRELAGGALKRNGEVGVKLLLEDGTPYPLEGKLQFSDITVEQTTGTVTLRAIFPNPENVLLPGLYVRALIDQGVREQAILAPQQGVTRNASGEATALVVGVDGKVEARVLKASRAVGNRWLVTDGLQAGDKLIVDGLQKVAPGVLVKPVDLTAK